MNGTIITRKGLQLIAKLMASGTALTFTKAAVGTGFLPSGYDPGSMQELNAPAMEGTISSCSCEEDEASIVFQVSSIGVRTGFTVTEAGLYASDPDEEEILYAYLDMRSDPQYVYPENAEISKFIEFTMVVKVGTVNSVTAYISPKSMVLKKEFDEEMEKKLNAVGGDISGTRVSTFSEFLEDGTEMELFPVPEPGELTKTLWGKVKKFAEDFRRWRRVITVVIPASGWSSAAPFTNRVEIEGIREKDNVDVTFIPAEGATNEENIAAWDGYVNINYTTTEDGAMVFHAFETKPEVDVTVAVKGMVQWEEEEPENPEGPDTPDPPEGPTDPGNTDTPEITDTPGNQDDV